MNLPAALRFSLIIGIVSASVQGTTCGAFADTKTPTPTPAVTFTQPENPELAAADERIKLAESQLDVARKQLSAAKSLLRAAEADLKAARADKQALALRTQAQDLAAQAGMDAPRSLAQTVSGLNVSATASAPSSTPAGRITQTSAPVARTPDFNAEQPVQSFEEQAPFPNIQLR